MGSDALNSDKHNSRPNGKDQNLEQTNSRGLGCFYPALRREPLSAQVPYCCCQGAHHLHCVVHIVAKADKETFGRSTRLRMCACKEMHTTDR